MEEPLVSYNLHLESRGDNEFARSQLLECLNDAGQYKSAVPIILAGDLNLDVSRTTTACSDMSRAQFRNDFWRVSVFEQPLPDRCLIEAASSTGYSRGARLQQNSPEFTIRCQPPTTTRSR